MNICIPNILVSKPDPYHLAVLRNQLNRNLGVLFPQTHDEIVRAFDEIIPLTSGELLRV